MEKLIIFLSRKQSNTKIWLLFLYLGWSYGSMEQMGKQVLFYLTVGGCGIWWFYRLITLNEKIRKYNMGIARELKLSDEEILKLHIVTPYQLTEFKK